MPTEKDPSDTLSVLRLTMNNVRLTVENRQLTAIVTRWQDAVQAALEAAQVVTQPTGEHSTEYRQGVQDAVHQVFAALLKGYGEEAK